MMMMVVEEGKRKRASYQDSGGGGGGVIIQTDNVTQTKHWCLDLPFLAMKFTFDFELISSLKQECEECK